jgi:hypothetical protein
MEHRLNVTLFAFCRLIIFTPIRMIYSFLLALAACPTMWAFFLSLFLVNLGDNVFTPAA